MLLDEHDEDATCRVCGCTQHDCSECVEKTGRSCYWIEADLCSACVVLDAAQVLKLGPLSVPEIAVQVGVSEAAIMSVLGCFVLWGPTPTLFAIERPNGFRLTTLGYERLIEALMTAN